MAARPGKPDERSEIIGYQPEYSATELLRKSVRETLDTLLFEGLVILLVCIYAVIIFIDLTVAASTGVDDPLCISSTGTEISSNSTLGALCGKVEERDWLYYLDLTFLSVFMVEIFVRIFGFGQQFFYDAVQVIDMAVVTMAFILAVIPEDIISSVDFLNVLRIIRLFRLAVIINKLQRSREAANMRSKVRATLDGECRRSLASVAALWLCTPRLHQMPGPPLGHSTPHPTKGACTHARPASGLHGRACPCPPSLLRGMQAVAEVAGRGRSLSRVLHLPLFCAACHVQAPRGAGREGAHLSDGAAVAPKQEA